MRTIGHRKEHPITFSASAALLAEGARFNDEIHRLPTSTINLEGLLLTKQTIREKDVSDRIILERALETLRERASKPESDHGFGL